MFICQVVFLAMVSGQASGDSLPVYKRTYRNIVHYSIEPGGVFHYTQKIDGTVTKFFRNSNEWVNAFCWKKLNKKN